MDNYLSKDTYFIKNNKKVYLEDNKLIYDNKVLYSSKKGRSMDLYYTDKIGYVAFADYEIK